MLRRVIQFGLATILSTAVIGLGVAEAQDEPSDGSAAPDMDGDGTPDSTEAAPATTEGDGTVVPADSTAAVAKKFRIGVAALAGLPMSDFGDVASFSVGGLLMGEFTVNPMIGITARLGYIYHITKDADVPGVDGTSLATIPVWIGGKYYFGTMANRLFVDAEIGFNNMRSSADTAGGDVSDSETDFGLNLGLGYDMGPISLNAFLTMYDLGNAGESMAINASVGYYFAAF
jgi:hypothetical protein